MIIWNLSCTYDTTNLKWNDDNYQEGVRWEWLLSAIQGEDQPQNQHQDCLNLRETKVRYHPHHQLGIDYSTRDTMLYFPMSLSKHHDIWRWKFSIVHEGRRKFWNYLLHKTQWDKNPKNKCNIAGFRINFLASKAPGSCAIDFQTQSVLPLNKKLIFPIHFQFFYLFSILKTMGLKDKCTWSGPICC